MIAFTSLLALTVSGVTPTTYQTIVDLSADLEPSTEYDDNAAFDLSLQRAAKEMPLVRTVLVLERGRIISSYSREDVDATETSDVYSVTKSWTGLIIGKIVEDGLLSINETLGNIWPDPYKEIWPNVESAEEIRAVTIESMLTMTSGLIDPTDLFTMAMQDRENLGGATLIDSLSFPAIGEVGEFSYLSTSNILSYVILKRSGLTPREYAVLHIFPYLGISDNKIVWDHNDNKAEHAYTGLHLNIVHMAKFGQLYLQGGYSNPETSIISTEWVQLSTTSQIAEAEGLKYGYFTWYLDNYLLGSPDSGHFYCALGLGGQQICIHDELDRVFVQQLDFELSSDDVSMPFKLAFMAFNISDLSNEIIEESTEAPQKSSVIEEVINSTSKEASENIKGNAQNNSVIEEVKNSTLNEAPTNIKGNETSSAQSLFARGIISLILAFIFACADFLCLF